MNAIFVILCVNKEYYYTLRDKSMTNWGLGSKRIKKIGLKSNLGIIKKLV